MYVRSDVSRCTSKLKHFFSHLLVDFRHLQWACLDPLIYGSTLWRELCPLIWYDLWASSRLVQQKNWFLYYGFKKIEKNQTWKGISKKNENHFQKGPPQKTNLLFQMGGLTPVYQPWSLFVSSRMQEPLAAQLDATLQRKKGNEPYLMRSGGETIWMGSDLMNRMNVVILWQISPIVFFWKMISSFATALLRRCGFCVVLPRRSNSEETVVGKVVWTMTSSMFVVFFPPDILWFFMQVGGWVLSLSRWECNPFDCQGCLQRTQHFRPSVCLCWGNFIG